MRSAREEDKRNKVNGPDRLSRPPIKFRGSDELIVRCPKALWFMVFIFELRRDIELYTLKEMVPKKGDCGPHVHTISEKRSAS